MARYKTIAGKKYGAEWQTDSKKEANTRASYLRKNGYSARITKEKLTVEGMRPRKGYIYVIWTRT